MQNMKIRALCAEASRLDYLLKYYIDILDTRKFRV